MDKTNEALLPVQAAFNQDRKVQYHVAKIMEAEGDLPLENPEGLVLEIHYLGTDENSTAPSQMVGRAFPLNQDNPEGAWLFETHPESYMEVTLETLAQTLSEYYESAEQHNPDLNGMEPDLYDDQMDGDHESALASAGLGTDEDYGCFGGEE